jgi:tetratricopeptide (TPR) repeat protein
VNQPLTLQGFAQRAPKIAFVPEFYLFKFLWPTRLTIEYSLQGFRENVFVLGMASAALGLTFLTIVFRGHRARSLGWLLAWGYVVTLIPVMNLLPTHPAVADRYAQLALVWLAPLLLVPVLGMLPRVAAIVLVLILVPALSVLSYRQVGTWRDEPTLFAHATTVNPHAIHSLGNLGTVLWQRGAEEEALEVFARLARLRPLDFRRDYYRGVRAMREGDVRAAELWLTAASQKRGLDLYRAHMRLGELYLEMTRYSEARAALERAIVLIDRAPSPGDDRQRIERSLLLLRGR